MTLTELNFKEQDFDKNGYLKPSSILMMMQKAAVSDAEKYGASRDNLIKDNMFFAVYRNALSIKEQITKETKKAYLVTFQSDHDRMRFMRSYFIYLKKPDDDIKNPYENALIYCNSIWILMDFEKRRLLRSDSLKYPIEEYFCPFDRLAKISVDTTDKTPVGSFKGNEYYIDENGHVNNTVYADVIRDFSDCENTFSYVDIGYEHEILQNDTVFVFTEETQNGKKFIGVREEDKACCFTAEIRF